MKVACSTLPVSATFPWIEILWDINPILHKTHLSNSIDPSSIQLSKVQAAWRLAGAATTFGLLSRSILEVQRDVPCFLHLQRLTRKYLSKSNSPSMDDILDEKRSISMDVHGWYGLIWRWYIGYMICKLCAISFHGLCYRCPALEHAPPAKLLSQRTWKPVWYIYSLYNT